MVRRHVETEASTQLYRALYQTTGVLYETGTDEGKPEDSDGLQFRAVVNVMDGSDCDGWYCSRHMT